MNRLLLIPLVLSLSGAPVAALYCDLLLCPDAAPRPHTSSSVDSAAAGCHEHAAAPSGRQVTAGSDECRHLAAVDPYLTSASRAASGDRMVAVLPAVVHRPLPSHGRAISPGSNPRPPGVQGVCASRPLRI